MDNTPEGLDGAANPDRPNLTAKVKPLPWASRLSAMPFLAGGTARQVEALRELLQAVVATQGLLSSSVTDGTGQPRSLRDALKPLSSAGFVQQLDREHVSLTAESAAWLDSSDDAALLAILHRHVRYVGEMLDVLRKEPVTVRDLTVAAGHFDLSWSTLDQARRRVAWLSALGAVEYKTSKLVALTPKGLGLLETVELDGPTMRDDATPRPVEVTDPPPAIADLLAELDQTTLAARNPVLGYVPRGQGGVDVVQALQALVNAASPSTTKEELRRFAEKQFGVSESSFGAVLTTLTKSGLLEQTSLNVYSPTAPALSWLETADPLDLALVIHARYLFVLEIIPMLGEVDRAPELARAAVDYFGMTRADAGGVRTRIQILKAAGLIAERANWRYRATPLGEAMAARYALQAPQDHADLESTDSGLTEPGAEEATRMTLAREIAREIRDAATDSDNPMRLEAATARAFQFLGFEATHIGGGGKTDVLVTVDNDEIEPVRIIVDAKSSRSGSVNEGAVSFDTLREHKLQHGADRVALVGPGFDAGRIRARAAQNGVALITAAGLASAVLRHANTPLSAHHYLGLIPQKTDDDRALETHWASTERRLALLAQVTAVLAEEARDADEVTDGALSSDQIYLITREGSAGNRPQPADIEAVLHLLQHPLVGAVRAVPTDRGRPAAFRLIDDPRLVREKLATLARALDDLGDHQSGHA